VYGVVVEELLARELELLLLDGDAELVADLLFDFPPARVASHLRAAMSRRDTTAGGSGHAK
jgi:hypothetical protein